MTGELVAIRSCPDHRCHGTLASWRRGLTMHCICDVCMQQYIVSWGLGRVDAWEDAPWWHKRIAVAAARAARASRIAVPSHPLDALRPVSQKPSLKDDVIGRSKKGAEVSQDDIERILGEGEGEWKTPRKEDAKPAPDGNIIQFPKRRTA